MSGPSVLLHDADRDDVQALVLYGTKSPLLRYHFFTIDQADAARTFIDFFLRPGPLGLNTAGNGQNPDSREHLVFVAFTWPGLAALGLDPLTLGSFPEAFRGGARHGAVETIGDTDSDTARRWTISDDTVHLAVMLYAREKQALFNQSTILIKTARSSGCSLVSYLDGEALPDVTDASGQRLRRSVHFGFSDGLSQPGIAGEDDP